MTDRRRTSRYVLGSPLPGNAMPMEDVTVERCSDARVVVISPSAHRIDEPLVIHMRTADGLQSHHTHVVSASPVTVAGALCFRLELHIDSDPGQGERIQ
jgi:hypothetical protein